MLGHIAPDADPEHLHDFRVALRRSRSLTRLVAGRKNPFESRIKPILKSTNALREIDVMLGGIDTADYPALSQKLAAVRAERYRTIWTEAHRKHCRRTLTRLLQRVHKLDRKDDETVTALGLEAYARASRARKTLSRQTQSSRVHKVRILHKEARYALEFLHESGLHPAAKKIARCKKLLNHYGAIQDAADQLELLKHFCKEHTVQGCETLLESRREALDALKSKL